MAEASNQASNSPQSTNTSKTPTPNPSGPPNPTSPTSQSVTPPTNDASDPSSDNNVEKPPASVSKAKPPVAKLRKRGNPGFFKPEQVALFEEHYPTWAALKQKKAKERFWDSFMLEYWELFPLSDEYPAPDPPKAELGAAQTVMDGKAKKARRKAEKRREIGPEMRMVQAVKGRFQAIQQKASGRYGPFLKYMQSRRAEAAPRKRQLRQFLLGHVKYKDRIREASKETGSHDRLSCRLTEADSVIAAMEEEDLKSVTKERDELFNEAHGAWVERMNESPVTEEERAEARETLPNIVQPMLDMIHDMTGFSVILQAGIDTGDPDLTKRYDTYSFCSTDPICSAFCDFNMTRFANFSAGFNEWLGSVRKQQNQAATTLSSEALDKLIPMPAEGSKQAAESSKVGKTREKGKKTKVKGGEKMPNKRAVKTKKKAKSKKDVDFNSESEQESFVGDPSDDEEEEEGEDGEARAGSDNDNEAEGKDEDGEGKDKDEDEDEDEGEKRVRRVASVPYSKYEMERLQNIERNKAILAQLGLSNTSQYIAGSVDVSMNRVEEERFDTPGSPSTLSPPEHPSAPSKPSQEPVADKFPKDDAVEHRCTDPELPERGVSEDPSPVLATTLARSLGSEISSNQTTSKPSLEAPESHVGPVPTQRDENHLIDDPTSKILPQPSLHNSDSNTEDTTPNSRCSAAPMDVDESSASPSLLSIKPFKEYYGGLTIPAPFSYPLSSSMSAVVREYAELLLRNPQVERPDEYSALVYKWASLEEKMDRDCEDDEGLTAMSRPKAFKQWYQDGRATRPAGYRIPKTASLAALREEWWTWWDTVNPDWRPRVGGKIVPGGSGEWSELKMRGRAGILQFVVAIRWWHDLGGPTDPDSHWLEAVKSLYFTMDAMLLDPPPICPFPFLRLILFADSFNIKYIRRTVKSRAKKTRLCLPEASQ
ncbi:SERTA domain-containing protein 3 [Marasmius crinis-equi]|uniref:SERTA domain-containing protein 3 n=1 Tax=Marasmius crinis-equi TaxID=585013 RepID=A0ABR3EQZ5_9AGAR